MIVGDEHIAVIAVEGRLPAELDREALFVVPAAEYAAAAAVYQATIWFGHDRNVPRAIRDGLVPGSVRWRLLSQLPSWNR